MMRNSWKIATAATMLAVMLSLSSGASAQEFTPAYTVTHQPGEQAITLKEQAKVWMDELSSSGDETFKDWRGSWISTAPLGPGTHSWLVLLKKNQLIVGYMVVYAKDAGGFILGEYGIGEYPPFSNQSLQLTLEKLGLTGSSMKARRLYVHPLQAAWQVTTNNATTDIASNNVHYTDAYSGEELPVDSEGWSRLQGNAKKHGLTNAHASVIASSAMSAFDPYGRLPWLTSSPYPFSSNPAAIMKENIGNGAELRYVSEAFQGRMLYVWSVLGYTTWSDGELFISLSSDENAEVRRYIPASLLLTLGQFYR
ncbi:hypothetical protein ACX1C1_23085 [Paenibacillus sp. strain BS8-2]